MDRSILTKVHVRKLCDNGFEAKKQNKVLNKKLSQEENEEVGKEFFLNTM